MQTQNAVVLENVLPLSAAPQNDSRDQAISASFKWFQRVFVATFAYATIRYIGLSGVALGDLPLYIVNKAMSFSAVLMLAFSMLIGPLARAHAGARALMPQRKFIGLIGFGAALLHSLMSLLMMGPVFYPKFYVEATGRLTGIAQLAFLSGMLGLSVFAVLAITSLASVRQSMGAKLWKATHDYGTLGLMLVLSHLASIGVKGWLTPEKWPAALPPITLLAAIPAVAVLIYRGVRRSA